MNNTKRTVTENERNAVFTTLTPEECLLLGQSLKELCSEYKEKGSLSVDSVVPCLGKYPNIPCTHDTDAMLEAFDEQVVYAEKLKSIEDFLEYELQRGHI